MSNSRVKAALEKLRPVPSDFTVKMKEDAEKYAEFLVRSRRLDEFTWGEVIAYVRISHAYDKASKDARKRQNQVATGLSGAEQRQAYLLKQLYEISDRLLANPRARVQAGLGDQSDFLDMLGGSDAAEGDNIKPINPFIKRRAANG